MADHDRDQVGHVLLRESALTEPCRVGEPVELAYHLRDAGELAVVGAGGEHRAFAVKRDAPPADGELPDADLVIVIPETAAGKVHAIVRSTGGRRRVVDVTVRPAEADVFDRLRGVFESDRVRDKRVLIAGCGSGGSFVLRELVRSGVGSFVLIDHDRLEVANVCRHELGLADLGRLKVNALRDYILDRNPTASVDSHAFRISGETFNQFLEILELTKPDVVVCGTDNRESRLLVNRACLLTNTVSVYGGVRRRAYAGQVLRVIPGLTPCYQCFLHSLPEVAVDREVSSANDAAQVAYSDRPVVAEPGLSTDIAPVALFIAKLVLLELTAEHQSPAFDSLREDLVAPWFFWLNRREPDTAYAEWPPLLDSMTGPSVLRWMGQWLARDENCAACGTSDAPLDGETLRAFGTAVTS
jgi:molybdopterin/thiamine biosynthesis adenylyltransferase